MKPKSRYILLVADEQYLWKEFKKELARFEAKVLFEIGNAVVVKCPLAKTPSVMDLVNSKDRGSIRSERISGSLKKLRKVINSLQ